MPVVNCYIAGSGGENADHDFNQGGFSGAVFPDAGQGLSLLHLKGDIVQRCFFRPFSMCQVPEGAFNSGLLYIQTVYFFNMIYFRHNIGHDSSLRYSSMHNAANIFCRSTAMLLLLPKFPMS